MSRRVLVTGAGGFLGRACVARLMSRGDHVICISRSDLQVTGAQVVRLDLAGDLGPMLDQIAAPDAIVHLAQEPGWHGFPVNSARIVQVASGATAQLLEYAARAGVGRFVYASSGGIYGPSEGPISESAPINPTGDIGYYLAAKAAGDMLVRAFRPAPFTTAVLRYFFVYGPGQRTDFLVPRLFNSVQTGASVTLAQGRGPKLNPVFVSDAAEATIAALDQAGDTVVNIGGPDTWMLRDMVQFMGGLVGLAPVLVETDECVRDFMADTSAAHALHVPRVGLEEGLRAVFESKG